MEEPKNSNVNLHIIQVNQNVYFLQQISFPSFH